MTAQPNQDSAKQDPHPYAKVTSIRPVVRDGWYNAFTDLSYWKQMYWLCYRRGTGHGAGNSVEVVLRSNDLRRWHEVAAFESPYGIDSGCATADGHFCVTSDQLYLVLGTRNPGHAFALSTTNGYSWSEPALMKIGDLVPYFWRIRWHDGRFYAPQNCFQDTETRRLDLVVSDDAVQWTRHAAIAEAMPDGRNGPDDGFTEESDLHWRPDGSMWCVVRAQPRSLSYCAVPPYTAWEHDLVLHEGCDAPVMCACGDAVYLAGRCKSAASRGLHNTFSHPQSPFSRWRTTGLYRLRPGQADLLVTLPPGADAAYAGLISPEPGKLVLSTYSDVAYISGQVRPMHFPEYQYKRSDCDIYIAQIEVGQAPAWG